MLMLTRNINQSFIIKTNDGDIAVIISNVKGKQVRVGIEAPDSVSIWRTELLGEEEQVA